MEIKLNRDYANNPLKRGEFPDVDDIKFLFITLNLSREECAKICHCTSEKIKIVCVKNKIQKTKEQRAELRKRTNLQKYGVENISQLDNVKDKRKQTCINKYGVENPAQSKEIYQKIRETCIDKYGVESTNMLEEKKEKIRETISNRYGVDNIMQLLAYKEKRQKTCEETYGVENVSQNEQVKEKRKKTCLKKYKNTSVFGSQYFRDKTQQCLKEMYGVNNIMEVFNGPLTPEAEQIRQKIISNFPNMIKKMNETKRKNGTFNTSYIEQRILEKLQNRFIVEYQYQSDEYPFQCDYYLSQLDLYIEFHGNWTHGGCPFEDNEYCKNQLERWQEKAKSSKYYQNAIYTWTDLDVRKRKIAQENGLNWICFYSEKEFNRWLQQI